MLHRDPLQGATADADWPFRKATTWEELQVSHDRWVNDCITQEDLAHHKREDGRRGPSKVLSWATGQVWALEELQRVFRTTRCERRVNGAGCIRFRHWDLYGEHGLAKQRVAVWLSVDAETLTVEHSEEPLAQYTVKPESDHKHLKSVTPLRLFETRFRSPQLPLWEPGVVDWHLALQRPAPAPRRGHKMPEFVQQRLRLDDSDLAVGG